MAKRGDKSKNNKQMKVEVDIEDPVINNETKNEVKNDVIPEREHTLWSRYLYGIVCATILTEMFQWQASSGDQFQQQIADYLTFFQIGCSIFFCLAFVKYLKRVEAEEQRKKKNGESQNVLLTQPA